MLDRSAEEQLILKRTNTDKTSNTPERPSRGAGDYFPPLNQEFEISIHDPQVTHNMVLCLEQRLKSFKFLIAW